jgi:ABC-type lipoprotein release transport system permease subunit
LNFQEKSFSIKPLFLHKILKKTKEKQAKITFLKILGNKYEHCRRHFDFSGLATIFVQ